MAERIVWADLTRDNSLDKKGYIRDHPLTIKSCFKNLCQPICCWLNLQMASGKRNTMDDKFFAGLHKGLLVHRLYLMSGTEVLHVSPANWKVTSIDDEFLELINLTVHPSFPYMVDHLEAFTGPYFTTKLRVRKAAIAGIEFVIDYPKNTTFD